MLNFAHSFFLKIGAIVTGVFLAVGGAGGTHPLAEDSQSNASSSPVVTSTQVVTKEAPAAAKQTQLTPKPSTSIQEASAAPVATALIIENVHAQVTTSLARITWTTTMPAESQLLMDNGDGKGFESIKGISTSHEVDISNPVESQEYDYKIVASTPDNKFTDDYYGSFTGVEKFVASFGVPENTDADTCAPIIVKNTSGKLIPNKQIQVVEWNSGINMRLGSESLTTDARGQIDSWQNCKGANKLVIKGDGIDMTLVR